MKVLLFYRSFRQWSEIRISAEMLNRTNTLKKFDLIFHCNNLELNVWEQFKLFPNKNKELIHTSINAGYLRGCLQALSNNFHKFEDYDFVIHLQTDVFITDEEKILEILNAHKNTEDVFIFTKSLQDDTFLSMDFFIFKPKLLQKNIFTLWENSEFTRPTQEFNSGGKWWRKRRFSPMYPEHLLYKIVSVNEIRYKLIKRFDNDHWIPRRIDLLNLWHEHDLKKVDTYLKGLKNM